MPARVHEHVGHARARVDRRRRPSAAPSSVDDVAGDATTRCARRRARGLHGLARAPRAAPGRARRSPTSAPRAANAFAVASPMPLLPPVTSTTLPAMPLIVVAPSVATPCTRRRAPRSPTASPARTGRQVESQASNIACAPRRDRHASATAEQVTYGPLSPNSAKRLRRASRRRGPRRRGDRDLERAAVTPTAR